MQRKPLSYSNFIDSLWIAQVFIAVNRIQIQQHFSKGLKKYKLISHHIL